MMESPFVQQSQPELSSRIIGNAVVTAPIPLLERLRCGAIMVRWIVRYAPNLAKDLLVAAASLSPKCRRREGIYNWE
jgi:hypothetical protein